MFFPALLLLAGVWYVSAESDIIHDADVKCDASRMVFTIADTSKVSKKYGGNLTVFNKDSKTCTVAGSHGSWSVPGPFQITIGYKFCHTQIKAVLGSGGDPYGYYTNQHFIIAGNNGLDPAPTGPTNYTAFVYCWIGAHAHADTGTNGTGGGGGGGGGKVNSTDAVEMNVTDVDGNIVYDVTLGDPLILRIRKKPDNFDYNATLPTYCYFSDHIGGTGTPTARIPFVVEKCPNDGIMKAFDYITKMEKINITQYQVDFKAFTFSGVQGALGITCELLVCLNSSDGLAGGLCYKGCWDYPHTFSVSSDLERLFDVSRPFEERYLEAKKKGSILTRKKLGLIVKTNSPTPGPGPVPIPDDEICMSKEIAYFIYSALAILLALFLVLLSAIVCILCGAAAGRRRRKTSSAQPLPAFEDRPQSSRASAVSSVQSNVSNKRMDEWFDGDSTTASRRPAY